MSFTRRQSPRVNLRWSLRVRAENVLTVREDDNLFLISSELQNLNISIAALSDVRRVDSGKVMVGGDTD